MANIPLDDLLVYQVAMEIGEEVWQTVNTWESFPKYSIGKQFCEAADSISANIAEGYGRFHFKKNRNFCFYARGSLTESKSWLQKSLNRKLIDDETYTRIFNLLLRCHQLLNKYIKSIGNSGDELNEPSIPYYSFPQINDSQVIKLPNAK